MATYKEGGTGKGSSVRLGLDVEKYEANMEKIRNNKPLKSEFVKEVVKTGNKTTYKF